MTSKSGDAKKHAQAMAALGAAKGGKARFKGVSKADRRELARNAALARWRKQVPSVPRAICEGQIPLGRTYLDVAVLEDGTRVVAERQLGAAFSRRDQIHLSRSTTGKRLPRFLSVRRLKPYITPEFEASLAQISVFRTVDGSPLQGRPVSIIPELCRVWVRALDAGDLREFRHQGIARDAGALLEVIAESKGIDSLVDARTSFDEVQARDELMRMIDPFIPTDFRGWTRRFPDQFFRQIFRLESWDLRPGFVQPMPYLGQLVTNYIFGQLPSGVLDELKKTAPVIEAGFRGATGTPALIAETGNQFLDGLVTAITSVLCTSVDNHILQTNLAKMFPKARPIRLAEPEGPRTKASNEPPLLALEL